MSIKILLDTDIGSDIDDAVCLAYLLANPECELLGITTVTGEAEKRAQIASALCRFSGKRIAIFPGAEKPLLVPQKQLQALHASALERWDHDAHFPKGQAIDFLRKTIRAHPNEIVLLTIGPLTNIALLFAVDPEIPSLLKGLVMMCGVFTTRFAGCGRMEYNAMLDPHATAMVYQHSVKIHRSIGLDVTRQVTMSAKEVRDAFRVKWLKPILDMAEIWFQQTGRDSMTFHDPLAAATIFDGPICQFERGTVEVELASQNLCGMTHWTPHASGGKHEIALGVDRDRFLGHYFSLFK